MLVVTQLPLRRETGDARRGRVHELDAPGGVEAVDAVGDVGQHALVTGEPAREPGLHVAEVPALMGRPCTHLLTSPRLRRCRSGLPACPTATALNRAVAGRCRFADGRAPAGR